MGEERSGRVSALAPTDASSGSISCRCRAFRRLLDDELPWLGELSGFTGVVVFVVVGSKIAAIDTLVVAGAAIGLGSSVDGVTVLAGCSGANTAAVACEAGRGGVG